MLQKIVYNDRPTSINNKNDAIKAIYQKGLKKAALEQNAFIRNGDLAVEILWKQHLPADIDNILKAALNEFDITKLINTILNRFKIFEFTKNYEFIFNTKEEVLVKADKQKMEQVLRMVLLILVS